MSPASSRAASPAATSAASTDAANSTVSKPWSRDELREHVDARLRQRRLERRVVGDVDLGRAERSRLRRERRCTPEPSTTPATSPPSCAAFESTPSDALVQLALVVLEEDEGAHSELPLGEEVDDLLGGAMPSSSILRVSPRGGGSFRRETTVRDPDSPTRPLRRPRSASETVLLRLLLGAHDPLQRRVARLVDRVGDGDDGRQRRLDHVVAELGLPLAA